VSSVAYHPDGRRVASADAAGVLKMWDVTRDQRALVLSPTTQMSAVAFSADDQSVLAAWTPDSGGIRAWDATTGQLSWEQSILVGRRKEWPLNYVALSKDGRLYAAPTREDLTRIGVWEARTGAQVTVLRGHQARVRTLAFSLDGRRLASASGTGLVDVPQELILWRLPTAERAEPELLRLACSACAQCLAFSANGQRLAVGERGDLQPDGKTWKDGGLGIWDTATGARLQHWIAHPGTVQSVAFNPEGNRLASAGRTPDQSVRLWDAGTGQQLYVLSGPSSPTGVTFSPDGRRLAAVGYDSTVHLWDPATGEALLTLRGPSLQRPEQVACDSQVVFSADGTRLAVNAWMDSIFVWDARPSQVGMVPAAGDAGRAAFR
jgi:WD40 repeat protein